MEPLIDMRILDCYFFPFLTPQPTSVTNIFHGLFFAGRQRLTRSAFEIQDFLLALNYADDSYSGCAF